MPAYVAYEGPSLLVPDVKIAVIVSCVDQPSRNAKTGNMLQTYILRTDIDPVFAVKNDMDEAICGNCIHRQLRTCYVDISKSVRNVFNSYLNGNRIYLTDDQIKRITTYKKIRIGAYGDPAAAPTKVWEALTKHADGFTGYTHQWRTCDQELKKYCMASTDALAETDIANARGWRTFRVKTSNHATKNNEAICPATITNGRPILCETCLACCGSTGGRRGNIAVNVHGAKYKVSRFTEQAA